MNGLQLSQEDQQKLTAKIASEVQFASGERREILRAIQAVAWDKRETDDAKRIAVTMARFATLLVSLSEQADKFTQDNLGVQRKLTRLTWGLFWLTLVLAFVAAAQLYMMFK